MVDQSLVSYIKQNIRDGFPQGEILTALAHAGWERADIDEALVQAGLAPQTNAAPVSLPPELAGDDLAYNEAEHTSFLSRHGRLLILLVAVIIILPILAYGGFWAYQRFTATEAPAETPPVTAPAPPPPPAVPKIDPQAVIRDEQRLKDIEALQTALASYFTAKRSYPKLLDQLATEKILTTVPLDPKSGVQYLYSPFGETTLDYSLSFILETDIGTMKKGLGEVSPANPLKSAEVKTQDEIVKGIIKQEPSENLRITDLSQAPFYPGEEVSLSIESTTDLSQVFILVNHLKLVDEHFPFAIRFSAPKIPGEYPVQVFGFDKDGQTLSQTTKLIVKP